MKYWINTVSRDHVLLGKDGAFIQAGHGKNAPLKRLSEGDYVIYYSPKSSLTNGSAIQRFTAACQINDNIIYQVEVNGLFCPYRRGAVYLEAVEVDIKPLISSLSFIKNKQSWGYCFRFGLFSIPKGDFLLIAEHMSIKLA